MKNPKNKTTTPTGPVALDPVTLTPTPWEKTPWTEKLTLVSLAYKDREKTPDRFGKICFLFGLDVARIVLKRLNDPTRFNMNDPDNIRNNAGIVYGGPGEKETDRLTVFSPGEKETAIDSGYNPLLLAFFRDTFRVIETLEKEKNDLVKFDDYMTEATGQDLGDGLDLANDAVVALLDQLDKQAQRDPGQDPDLTRVYSLTRLRTRVYIQDRDDLKKETVETAPIIEIFRSVRRSVSNSRAMQADPRNGYSYIDYEYNDPDLTGEMKIYRRLPKYSDIGGYEMDHNKDHLTPVLTKFVTSTGDHETVENMDQILSELRLTDRQLETVRFRLRGYGKKAIATRLGVRPDSIRDRLRECQKKWTATGRPTRSVSEETDPENRPGPGKFVGPLTAENWTPRTDRPTVVRLKNGTVFYRTDRLTPVVTTRSTDRKTWKDRTPTPTLSRQLPPTVVIDGVLCYTDGTPLDMLKK